MSAFPQRLRKLGVRAGLLMGTSAAVLAIAGIGASSAVAAPACPNAGTIAGRGSSLQKEAQAVWTAGYTADCTSKPTKAEYTSTSSGSGLEGFGFKGTSSVTYSLQFIGSDDAPNATQIASAETAGLGAKPIIVPVAQTAIAIDVHPPTGCKFKTGKGITWANLNQIWGGSTITEWSQIANIEATTAGACNKPITRVVRSDGSGTTYQFKNYLSTLETTTGITAEGLPCTTDGHTKWAELEEVGAANKPNITWPHCSASASSLEPVEGGGGVAAKVVELEGSIGYSALPDTKSKGATPALLENSNVGGEVKYAEAGKEETKEGLTYKTARCENSRYEVPAGAQSSGSGVAVNWSTVFGAQPKIGGSEYPLCTLTYDVGWNNYVTAGYETEAVAKGTTATAWGEDVGDYIKNYIVPTSQGQKAIREKWYSAMPTDGGLAVGDVQAAAEHSAMQLP